MCTTKYLNSEPLLCDSVNYYDGCNESYDQKRREEAGGPQSRNGKGEISKFL